MLSSGGTCVGKGVYWGVLGGIDAGTSLILEFTRRWGDDKNQPTKPQKGIGFQSLCECADLKKIHPDVFCSRVLKLRG